MENGALKKNCSKFDIRFAIDEVLNIQQEKVDAKCIDLTCKFLGFPGPPGPPPATAGGQSPEEFHPKMTQIRSQDTLDAPADRGNAWKHPPTPARG